MRATGARARPPATCVEVSPTTRSTRSRMAERRRRAPARAAGWAARPPREDRGGGWTGTEFEVTVGPVAHGGHCVARHEGRVVFVRHSLPGERVVVRVTEDRHPGYCRADAVRVLEPSPHRVERPCPYSGPGRCGGCDWQHVTPAEQRRLKSAVVEEQLTPPARPPAARGPVGGPPRGAPRRG